MQKRFLFMVSVPTALLLGSMLLWQCERRWEAPLAPSPENPYTTLSKQAVLQAYDKPPEPIDGFSAISEKLQYPDVARQAGIQGRVILNLLIRSNSAVDSIIVLKSLSPECDRAAIEAVQGIKWRPAEKAGTPVDCWVGIPVTFRLGTAPLLSAGETLDSATLAGFLEKISRTAKYPAIARRAGIEGRVRLAVSVDRTGRVLAAQIDRSSGFAKAGLDAAALDAVKNKQWPRMEAAPGNPSAYQIIVTVRFEKGTVTIKPVSRKFL